jgi:hypothetical protein
MDLPPCPPNLPVIRCIQNCIWAGAYSKWDGVSNVLVYSSETQNGRWTYYLEVMNGLQYEVTRYNNKEIYRMHIKRSSFDDDASSLPLLKKAPVRSLPLETQ